MRDLETISLAITAAETGHLVFGTLHTTSAPKTIDRIIDAFPGEQQAQIRAMLSESLEAVIAQTLVKKKGGGRVAACEVLVGVPAVRNLIREGKLHQIPSMMQTGQRAGMQTLDMAYAELLKKGLIEPSAMPARPAMPGMAGAAPAAGGANGHATA
jgi:twitching motility protein PilT